MLELNIHGKNLEITPSIQEHVTTKLGSVDRHLPCISRAEVELISEPTRSQKDRVVVQVTLTVPGSLLRTQQRAANTKAAINSAAKALDRQIMRYKGQVYRSEREARGAPDFETMQAAVTGRPPDAVTGRDPEQLSAAAGDLVRVKRFEMGPMSVEEAALQMQFLDHSFYMFLDAETNQYSVVYLREDSSYGLIQPAT